MLSGGGTGGHVIPLLVVVNQLREKGDHRFLYVGERNSFEERLSRSGDVPFQPIAAGAMREASPLSKAHSLLRLAWGTIQTWFICLRYQPDVTLVSGGYVSVPAAVASWLWRIPVAIYLPDIVPGMAVAFLSRFARRIAISFPDTLSHLPSDKAVVTGYPVRAGLFADNRAAARQRLGLDPDEPVLLVLGGSRGAQSLNQAVSANRHALLAQAQIIHLCGALDHEWLLAEREQLSPADRARYHLYAFLQDEMVDAMQAADLAVSRAGASTMAEFPAAGLPSILVPYPYSGQHQDLNADYLVRQGAAVKLDDSEICHKIVESVTTLLTDGQRLIAMRQQARQLARPDAAANIAALLDKLGNTDRPCPDAEVKK